MLLGTFLLPLLIYSVAVFINFVAIYYQASRVISFGTMVKKTSDLVKVLFQPSDKASLYSILQFVDLFAVSFQP